MTTRSLTETIARKLGSATLRGTAVHSQADLALLVERRLPLSALGALSEAGLSDAEIDNYIIPPRTRRHRTEKQQPLTIEESDRAIRLLRIQSLAEEAFQDFDKAGRWLRKELTEFGGKAPLDVAQTEAGARVIETVLAKLVWGAAA